MLFSNDDYGHFERKRSSNDIIVNDSMSADEEVASDVGLQCLFILHLSCFSCPWLARRQRFSQLSSEINYGGFCHILNFLLNEVWPAFLATKCRFDFFLLFLSWFFSFLYF